jgi:2-iminoacetate synthase ThiH
VPRGHQVLYGAKCAKLDVRDFLMVLKEAGVDSLPGKCRLHSTSLFGLVSQPCGHAKRGKKCVAENMCTYLSQILDVSGTSAEILVDEVRNKIAKGDINMRLRPLESTGAIS